LEGSFVPPAAWEVVRAEGPASRPAKGAALDNRPHPILICCVFPHPAQRANCSQRSTSGSRGMKINCWPVGPKIARDKNRIGAAATPGLRPSLGEQTPLRGSHPRPQSRNKNRISRYHTIRRLLRRPTIMCFSADNGGPALASSLVPPYGGGSWERRWHMPLSFAKLYL
jgi:hypothetical protein